MVKLLSRVSLDICREFSAKARSYMLTYQHKSMREDDTNKDMIGYVKPKLEWSLDFNKKLHKLSKSHRDANIINCTFT